jgi:hypothetical protein
MTERIRVWTVWKTSREKVRRKTPKRKGVLRGEFVEARNSSEREALEGV